MPGEREQLQVTAQKLAHWQGTVDQRLEQHAEHLDSINGSVASMDDRLSKIAVEIALLHGVGDLVIKLDARIERLRDEVANRREEDRKEREADRNAGIAARRNTMLALLAVFVSLIIALVNLLVGLQ